MHGVDAGLPGQFVEQFVQPGPIDIPVRHGLGLTPFSEPLKTQTGVVY